MRKEDYFMRNTYLPDAKSDSIFAFLGNTDALILIAYAVIFAVLITLIIIMISKKRKDDK